MSNNRSDLVDIECTLLAETEKGILVSDDGENDNAVWLPKSHVEYETNHKTGVTIITMREWLGIAKGLL